MKSKDQQLLEQAYLNTLKENNSQPSFFEAALVNPGMKEKCFAYQNKKTQEWLKLYPDWNYIFEFYDHFDKSVMYSARNIIEEDFYRAKLEDREDWQLMEVEIGYNFTLAK